MKKSRFNDEQTIGFLKQVEAGAAVKELGRKHGLSDACFYKWRSRFGWMAVGDARRLRDLEGENGNLKKLLAEAMLDIESLKVIARGKR
jgi:putative transposase